VNRDIGALRPVFSRAVDWKLLAESPMKSIKALKSNADPIVRFLSSDEEKRLRAALDMRETREREGRARANIWRSARHYELLPHLTEAQYLDYLKPAVLLSINTGVRQGEMLKLRIADVNLENDPYIFIRGATAKSNKGRHVPLNDEAQAVLSQWIKQHPSEGALKGLVFPGKGVSRWLKLRQPGAISCETLKFPVFAGMICGITLQAGSSWPGLTSTQCESYWGILISK